jgi:hypothetical protein
MLKVEYIQASFAVGHIAEAIREAILLAITEDRVVKFEFNDTPISVDPETLVDFIGKQYQRPAAT